MFTAFASPLQKYDRALAARVEKLRGRTDTLGMPIDGGIVKLVAALQLDGFVTTASCEGHTDWGRPSPWVEIAPTSSRLGQRLSDCLGIHYHAKKTVPWRRLAAFLRAHYSAHPEVSPRDRLILRPIGGRGDFRLEGSLTREEERRLSGDARREQLCRYQKQASALLAMLAAAHA